MLGSPYELGWLIRRKRDGCMGSGRLDTPPRDALERCDDIRRDVAVMKRVLARANCTREAAPFDFSVMSEAQATRRWGCAGRGGAGALLACRPTTAGSRGRRHGEAARKPAMCGRREHEARSTGTGTVLGARVCVQGAPVLAAPACQVDVERWRLPGEARASFRKGRPFLPEALWKAGPCVGGRDPPKPPTKPPPPLLHLDHLAPRPPSEPRDALQHCPHRRLPFRLFAFACCLDRPFATIAANAC